MFTLNDILEFERDRSSEHNFPRLFVSIVESTPDSFFLARALSTIYEESTYIPTTRFKQEYNSFTLLTTPDPLLKS